MPNVTVSIPEEVYRKMKKYSEIKWSEVVRKALREYIERLERLRGKERDVRSSDELADTLRESGVDLSSVGLEEAVKWYERARELEWKRFSTIRACS